MLDYLKNLLKTRSDSVKGLINGDELWKSILTSFGVSSLTGLLIAILTSISTHASEIFPNGQVAWLAVWIIGLIVDLIRRQQNGRSVNLLAPGSTVPPSGAVSPPPAGAELAGPASKP